MSTEERDLILQMLSEGKISASEASDLLDALDTKTSVTAGDNETSAERPQPQLSQAERERRARLASRGLLIRVDTGEEGQRTHVRVPLGMALAGEKFIPKWARQYLDQYGISITDILESVTQGLGDEGEIVNVQEGDTRVLIAVT